MVLKKKHVNLLMLFIKMCNRLTNIIFKNFQDFFHDSYEINQVIVCTVPSGRSVGTTARNWRNWRNCHSFRWTANSIRRCKKTLIELNRATDFDASPS